MVLLHGASEHGQSWDAVVEGLAATHRVYVPDQRGHGASDWPGRYSFELLRDDVVGFLDALGIESVVLIGHSMGGTVAWLVAEDHPNRLTHLIVEDTAPPRPGREPLPKRVRPDRPLPFDWNAREAVVAQVNAPDPMWWQRAVQIATPTLIIAGGPDSHESQERLAELAGRLARCRLVTIPVGHHVHAQAPGAFVEAVHEFLAARSG
jgi:pimeloyl-ACP methyl ester carboxylesterase